MHRTRTTGVIERAFYSVLLVLYVIEGVSAQPVSSSGKLYTDLYFSAGLENMVIKDDAYSRISYGGWVPSGAAGASLSHGEVRHVFSINYTGGTTTADGLMSATMRVNSLGAEYGFLWAPGQFATGRRLYWQIGGSLQYGFMNRVYAGFINSREVRDQWLICNVIGEMRIPLGTQGRFGIRVTGGLGISGFFDLSEKWPDFSDLQDAAGFKFNWLLGSDGFSGQARTAGYWILGRQQVLELGFSVKGTKLERYPSWGFLRQGPVCTYSIRL